MAFKKSKGKPLETDIRLLINCITNLKVSSDHKNFEIAEKYVTLELLYHRYLDIIPTDVWKMSDKYYERFSNHAEHKKARAWKELTSKLKRLFDKCKQEGAVTSVLLLLMRLANLKTRLPPDFSTDLSFHFKEPATFDFSNDEDFMIPIISNDYNLKTDSLSSSDDEGIEKRCLGQISTDSGAEVSPEIEVASCLLLANNEPCIKNNCNDAHVKWLKDNVVQPYWIQNYFIASCYSNNRLSIKPLLVTEHIFMTECIWILHGVKNVFVFLWDGKSFKLREGISLAEVSQAMLESASKEICECSTFVVELQDFCSLCDNTKASRHVQRFALTLKQELKPLQEQLIKLEKILIDQENTMTLVILLDVLDPWLKHVRFLWNLFQVAIFQPSLGPKSPSSQTAHLLFTLFSLLVEVDNALGRHNHQFSTLLILFLETCGPFLDFVDQLLSCGQINDPHNEFIIERRIPEKIEDENISQNSLFMRDISKDHTSNCFLFVILRKVILAANLISTLNKIDLWKDFKSNSLSRTFIDKCYQKMELSKARSQRDVYFGNQMDSKNNRLVSVDVLSHLDPILKRYFQYVCPIDMKINEVEPDKCLKREDDISFFKEEEPFQIQIEETLLQLVSGKCDEINKWAIEVMKGELCIKDHMQAVANYFLFEDGASMKQFASEIFRKILNRETWKSSEHVKLLFEMASNATASSFKHINRFTTSLKCQDVTTASEYPLEELGQVTLKYLAPSPINIILNNDNLCVYQNVFCFLVKLNCAKYSLDNIRFNDLEDWIDWKHTNTASKQFLYLFRLNLLHFMNQLQYYFMIGVLHDKQRHFLHSLDSAEGFQEVLSLHQIHLEALQHFFLLSTPAIFLRVSHLLNLVVYFVQNWNTRTLHSGMKKMVSLEEDFAAHMWALSRSLSVFWRKSSFDKKRHTDLGVLSNLLAVQTRNPRPSNPLKI